MLHGTFRSYHPRIPSAEDNIYKYKKEKVTFRKKEKKPSSQKMKLP